LAIYFALLRHKRFYFHGKWFIQAFHSFFLFFGIVGYFLKAVNYRLLNGWGAY
jgi:hypothetical protein